MTVQQRARQCARDVIAIVPNRMMTMPDGTRLSLRIALVAIAGQESSWIATQPGDAVGSCSTCRPSDPHCGRWTSFGYFQFHLPAWSTTLRQMTGSRDPCTWAVWLKNGRHNVQLAWQAYQDYERLGQNGFRPWWPDVAGPYGVYPRVTETHPPYRKHLVVARQAVQAVEGTTVRTAPHTARQTVQPSSAPPKALTLLPLAALAAGAMALLVDAEDVTRHRSV